MKRFYLLLLGALLFGTTALMAQDVIVRKDGTTILAKVEKVGETTVEYRKWGNQEGALYTLSIANILSINYENGTRDSFESAASKDAPIAISGDGINAPNGSKSAATTPATQVQTTTTAKKSNWYRDEKWFVMNQDLIGLCFDPDKGLIGTHISILYARNLGRYFSAGVGFEIFTDTYYQYYDNNSLYSLYADLQWYILGKKKITPYYELRFGFCIEDGGIYAGGRLGLAIHNFRVSFGPTERCDVYPGIWPSLDVSVGWAIRF